MSKPAVFRTAECTTCHAHRSRARMYQGECTRCTGLLSLLYRNALGRFMALTVVVVRQVRRVRRGKSRSEAATQLNLF